MKQFLIASALVFLNGTAFADTGSGKTLHDGHCLKCHGTEVYTRENRFIISRDALAKQVNRCKLNTGAPWFEDETRAVVDYLDQSFYRFK